MDGIRHERQMLPASRDRAYLLIDMSLLTAADVTPRLTSHFAVTEAGLRVFVTSLDHHRGIRREAAPILDVGFLEHPYHVEALRRLTGRDRTVAADFESDSDLARFFARLWRRLKPLISGTTNSTIASGRTGTPQRWLYGAGRLTATPHATAWPAKPAHRDLPPCQAANSTAGRAALAVTN
jgi:RNase adaptor protein for sRNA GlmZ degradation